MTDKDIASWNKKFWRQEAEALLAWSSKMFGGRVVIPCGLNAGGMVILHKVFEVVCPNPLPHVFTIDTGKLFEETPQVIAACNKRYGIKIEIVKPDPEEVKILTAHRVSDFFLHTKALGIQCCEVRKVRPYAKKLREGNYAVCITGMIHEPDSPQRSSIPLIERDLHSEGTIKINPLASWTKKEVWDEIEKHNLPYHPQLDEFPHLACKPCTKPGGVRDGRRECGIN